MFGAGVTFRACRQSADADPIQRPSQNYTEPIDSTTNTPTAQTEQDTPNELSTFRGQHRVMVRDPFFRQGAPELQDVLDALDDRDCRTIIKRLDTPMTAREISMECDIPLSTTYRKLELLTKSSILDEQTEIRSDGHHTTRYALAFEAVEISLDDNDEFSVSITRPPRTADEQLERLWSEVRREA
jgi:hypothetical protein